MAHCNASNDAKYDDWQRAIHTSRCKVSAGWYWCATYYAEHKPDGATPVAIIDDGSMLVMAEGIAATSLEAERQALAFANTQPRTHVIDRTHAAASVYKARQEKVIEASGAGGAHVVTFLFHEVDGGRPFPIIRDTKATVEVELFGNRIRLKRRDLDTAGSASNAKYRATFYTEAFVARRKADRAAAHAARQLEDEVPESEFRFETATTKKAVMRMYRRSAKLLHPDIGGHHYLMVRLNQQKDDALRRIGEIR